MSIEKKLVYQGKKKLSEPPLKSSRLKKTQQVQIKGCIFNTGDNVDLSSSACLNTHVILAKSKSALQVN